MELVDEDNQYVSADDNGGKIYGDHETNKYECLDGDLQSYIFCKKNRSHEQFIPVNIFTINHLPEKYRKTYLFEFIKAIAQLTVRVDVEKVSKQRKEFWPGTRLIYPFYTKKGLQKLRTGSGLICEVNKYKNGFDDETGKRHTLNYTKCWCKKCKDPERASDVWCEFNVATAMQVVYDETEAYYTTLKLFYDNASSDFEIIDSLKFYSANRKRDLTVLKCVTCKLDLAEKLNDLTKQIKDLNEIVLKNYQQNRDTNRLTFIVSHPHGCFKQISYGDWVQKYKVTDWQKKFTYTTCTCPGSSGASVQCLGYFNMTSFYHIVHQGCLQNGFNISGAGM